MSKFFHVLFLFANKNKFENKNKSENMFSNNLRVLSSLFHRHLKSHDLYGAGDGSEVKDYQFVYWGDASHLRVFVDFQSFDRKKAK